MQHNKRVDVCESFCRRSVGITARENVVEISRGSARIAVVSNSCFC
jgi:hypothetical protein